jgi:hypothetical protein
MAKFNMSTVVEVADQAVATAALKAEKNPLYCHALLLKRVVEVGKATCQELYTWLEENKAALMPEAGVATWDKYSATCHLSYFVNRCRGAVLASTTDGTPVPQGPTKAKKAAVEAEVKEEAVEEPAEVVTAEEKALEEAGA